MSMPDDASSKSEPETEAGAATDTAPEPESKSVSESESESESESQREIGTDTAPAIEAETTAPVTDVTESEPTDSAGGLSLLEVQASCEALLYASADPLTLKDLRKAVPESPELVSKALDQLKELYAQEGRGLQLVEVAGGVQITTRPEFHERVGSLFQQPRPPRLSLQALETLAVVAYRQPITVPEIMELRGVRSAGVMRTLLERKLVRISGKKDVVGRPLLYSTTKEFLLRFGLKSLRDLPQLKDMSEVFGDEVAQQLDGLDDWEGQEQGGVATVENGESDPAEATEPASDSNTTEDGNGNENDEDEAAREATSEKRL
jgi:segregation and condensation protein B